MDSAWRPPMSQPAMGLACWRGQGGRRAANWLGMCDLAPTRGLQQHCTPALHSTSRACDSVHVHPPACACLQPCSNPECHSPSRTRVPSCPPAQLPEAAGLAREQRSSRLVQTARTRASRVSTSLRASRSSVSAASSVTCVGEAGGVAAHPALLGVARGRVWPASGGQWNVGEAGGAAAHTRVGNGSDSSGCLACRWRAPLP